MAYGDTGYGGSTYGSGTSGAFGTLGVVAPAAVANASMTAPAVAIGIVVAAPAASATASMTAPRVRLTPLFAAYDLDDNASQALQVAIDMSAVLEADVIPVLPSSGYTDPQLRGRRVSLIMPTPTLDSRGRPT